MKLTEELGNLIRNFHEKSVVEKIAEAKGDLAVYEEQKKVMKKELETFKAKAEEILKRQNYVICHYKIFSWHALQICFICIMTGIDDVDLLKNWRELPIALRQINGKLTNLAKNIAHFIGNEEGDDEAELFSNYDEEELLKKFFD